MLLDARSLVATGWAQGSSARDASGESVDPWSSSATQWSLVGALVAVWAKSRRTRSERDTAIAAFQKANLSLLAATRDSPQSWNDEPGRTRQEVLLLFELALFLTA
jgi:hypothetical protein